MGTLVTFNDVAVENINALYEKVSTKVSTCELLGEHSNNDGTDNIKLYLRAKRWFVLPQARRDLNEARKAAKEAVNSLSRASGVEVNSVLKKTVEVGTVVGIEAFRLFTRHNGCTLQNKEGVYNKLLLTGMEAMERLSGSSTVATNTFNALSSAPAYLKSNDSQY